MLPRESLWRVFVASFRCERELSPMKQAVTNEALFPVDADVFDGICIMVHNSRVNKSSDIHHGRYEWDARKASINAKEHGVTFVEAISAFGDPAQVTEVSHHRGAEERWQLIGFSAQARLLVVVHCERDGDRIRIISARRATRSDAHKYARRKG